MNSITKHRWARIAALTATLSVGGFIDFLASGYAEVADIKHRLVLTAKRKL